MKIFSKITTIIVTICIILSALTLPVSAAKNAVIAFNKSKVEVGDKVTVTVTVNPKKEMSALRFYLEYNDEVFKYDSGTGVGDAGVIHIEEAPSGQKSVSYNFTFKATKKGSSTFSVKDCVYFLQSNTIQTDDDAKSFGGASATLSVKDPKLSDNAKLKTLKISGYSLSPSFSSSKTSYTLKVPYDTKKINITAKTADSEAKVVSVKGNTDLKVGKNTVTVTVEAENGTQKTYTIKVTRLEEKDTSSEENTSSDDSKDQPLKTTIEDTEYLIATKIPQDILFKGFSTQTTQVNGFDIETAVDGEGNFRIFYLSASDSEELIPYLYDEDTDEFQKLKYYVFGENYYIFSQIPDEYNVPDNLYASNVNIGGFSVDCLSDTNTEMSDYHYLYCYSNGAFNLYRFDSLEGTLQRYPDFEKLVSSNSSDSKDNIFSRFSSLSTNGKVILLAFIIVILGIFALLIMLIVYLIKRSINNSDDFILSSDYDDFDQIDLQSDTTMRK